MSRQGSNLTCKVCGGPIEAIWPLYANIAYKITPTFYLACGHGESHTLADLVEKIDLQPETSGTTDAVSNAETPSRTAERPRAIR